MEDASNKQQNTLHGYMQSVKRLAVPRVGVDKRHHTEITEDMITPTPSIGSISTGDISDSDGLNSDNSRMSIAREQSTGTVVEADRMEKEKLKIALKLDRLKDKRTRYESHVTFLRKCLENDVIPQGLRTYVEPSIGNRDDEFLGVWHGILFDCSKKLINHSIGFSEKAIETTKTEIDLVTEQLKALMTEPAYKKIEDSLKKNDETRNKEITNRKNRKFYRLKYGEREREDRPPAPSNRSNEILNNRGQRGQGQPRRSDDTNHNNRRDNSSEQSRWNEWKPDQRYVNKNINNSNHRTDNREDQTQRRVIDVIERRTKNQSAIGRGPRASVTSDQAPIHEQIALSRRNSRRNVARNANESPREEFPPPSEGKRVTIHIAQTPKRTLIGNAHATMRSRR